MTKKKMRTTASNAGSILSGSQIASMRCSVDAGVSRSADAVTVSTSCVSRRDASLFFHAEDGIRGRTVTGVQTCALPICDLRGTPGLADIELADEVRKLLRGIV